MRLEELADYDTDLTRVVTDADAASMIADATRFVVRVRELLEASPKP